MLLFWPEKSLASSYKTIAVATKIISHLSNIETGGRGVGCAFWAIVPIIMSLIARFFIAVENIKKFD